MCFNEHFRRKLVDPDDTLPLRDHMLVHLPDLNGSILQKKKQINLQSIKLEWTTVFCKFSDIESLKDFMMPELT